MCGKKVIFTILAGLIALAGCDSAQKPVGVEDSALDEYTASEQPIVNGLLVTGEDRMSTVALMLINSGTNYGAFCTGTLISQDYVLTAGHCIMNCDDEEVDNIANRPFMYVAIAQNENKPAQIYPIEAFYPHPDFQCTPTLKNDIAILKLKDRVPVSVALPTPPLPPELLPAPAEIDSAQGVMATSVGFGTTIPNNAESKGTKYQTTRKIYAVCPLDAKKNSAKCGENVYIQKQGIVYLDAEKTATCKGDSGGPTFVTRNGLDYVIGVTSYGYTNCKIVNGMTLVTDYYDYILKTVPNLPAAEPEDCFTPEDDNGDGRINCDDPYCFGIKACTPEDCFNGIDDNENGLVDCDDPACSAIPSCQPEICNDKIDNNGNGLVDCDDPACVSEAYCKPEDCFNHVDDNGDGLIDCADPQCSGEKICAPEICGNGIDDNKDGLIDCADPMCAAKPECQYEICNDGIDNNSNGLIDCADPQCAVSPFCMRENCTNGIDDNFNGLTDCFDPQCALEITCQPEICNDEKDNNGNGLIDCDDPDCEKACSVDSASGGCAASGQPRPISLMILLLSLCSLLIGRFNRVSKFSQTHRK